MAFTPSRMIRRALLTDFRPIRPRYEVPQDSSLAWLAKAHYESHRVTKAETEPKSPEWFERALRRFGCTPKDIAFRASDLRDFTHERWDEMEVFALRPEAPGGKDIGVRTDLFLRFATEAFERLYAEDGPPAHLLHVTCTGFTSPSPAQVLVSRKSWGSTRVTHAYQMGCYASLPSVRIAEGLLASGPKAERIDLLHTEYCSLHFDPSRHSPEQFVVESLFGDGVIRYTLQDESISQGNGLLLLAVSEALIPNTLELMTWNPGVSGMRMTLSREVPERIRGHVGDFVSRMLREAGLPGSAVQDAEFAIHPGGPRILDSISGVLGLREDQIRHSRDVLRRFGNMSSATLPSIWKEILEDPAVPSGKIILSLAFGPGLTIFGSLLEKRA